MVESKWSPPQYERFKSERQQPFLDLLSLVHAYPGGRVADLGCGTGELTRQLHETVGAAETIGIDNSETMLGKSAALAGSGLSFRTQTIESFDDAGGFDIIFANASLQWVDDHPQLLARLTHSLRRHGQLAVQVPANHDHVSHRLAADIAVNDPFRQALHGYVRRSPVLPPEHYAALLDQFGYSTQHVRLQVYPHHLSGAEEVVEWNKGTMLIAYQQRLDADLFEQFLAEYRRRVVAALSDQQPLFYPFKRILFWGRRAA